MKKEIPCRGQTAGREFLLGKRNSENDWQEREGNGTYTGGMFHVKQWMKVPVKSEKIKSLNAPA